MISFPQFNREVRRGFTLVELMVVVGIIALLITIIVPAVGAARKAAKAAVSKATIGTLETGLEQYRADSSLENAYPPSGALKPSTTGGVSTPIGIRSPHDDAMKAASGNDPLSKIDGASLLVWAMAGADYLGTPGFKSVGSISPFWADCTGTRDGALYDLNAGKPVSRRFGPFVDISKMKLSKQQLNNGAPLSDFVLDELPTKPHMASAAFLDAFGQPILYFKANPTAVVAAWDSQSPGDTENKEGIYDFADAATVLKYPQPTGNSATGMDLGAGYIDTSYHRHQVFNLATFTNRIHDSKVTVTDKPCRPDSFLLWSAGPNAIFGDSDDVANFPVNQ